MLTHEKYMAISAETVELNGESLKYIDYHTVVDPELTLSLTENLCRSTPSVRALLSGSDWLGGEEIITCWVSQDGCVRGHLGLSSGQIRFQQKFSLESFGHMRKELWLQYQHLHIT